MARASARERLLDCAEALFADHGLSGVSLRAINAEAGLSPAALHYHFGSQRSLVEALLERRMPSLMGRRQQLLDSLEASAEAPSTRAVLEALMQPLAELLAEGGADGARYLRLIHRLRADGDLDPAFVVARWPGGVDRLVPLLARANPALPRPLVELRLAWAIDLLLRSLAHGPAPDGGLEAHANALLDFLTGAFEAPVTSPHA
ncbi:MAG: TetR/AcrR family transcriptional regulator [Myxococcota bacterium]